MKPKISVITVVYNAADTLEQTMLSVLNQTYDNIEYIIIDGGSTDGSVDIIKKYADRLAYWVSEPDKGIYDAMNKGIRKATGDWIGIINADDWYEEGVFEKIAELLAKSYGIDILYGKLRYYDFNDFSKKIFIWGKKYDERKIWRKYRMFLAHPTCFVNHNTYNEKGLFDTSYKIAADYDFVLRCILNEGKFLFADFIISNMSAGGVSDQNFLQGFIESNRIAKKHKLNVFLADLIFFHSVIMAIERKLLNYVRNL